MAYNSSLAIAQSGSNTISVLKKRIISLDFNKVKTNFNIMFKECAGAGCANIELGFIPEAFASSNWFPGF